jgi:pantothenate kinase
MLLRLSLAKTPKILAPHGYSISSNALIRRAVARVLQRRCNNVATPRQLPFGLRRQVAAFPRRDTSRRPKARTCPRTPRFRMTAGRPRGLSPHVNACYNGRVQNSGISFPQTLSVTEQEIKISGLTDAQKQFYLDFFDEMVRIYKSRQKPRVIIGIAGPTGAGKSVIAALLKVIADQQTLPFIFETLTIDAYHYPNEFLLSHASGDRPLKDVKGRYDTYDVKKLAGDLEKFVSGNEVSLPKYSRKLHDPVENSVTLAGKEVLLVVEGLWLLFEQAGWEMIRPFLDFVFFIESDREKAKASVVQRHVRGGRTCAEAMKYYDEVDARNFDLVVATRSRADKVMSPYYCI